MRNLATLPCLAQSKSKHVRRLVRRKSFITDGPFAETKEAVWSVSIANERETGASRAIGSPPPAAKTRTNEWDM